MIMHQVGISWDLLAKCNSAANTSRRNFTWLATLVIVLTLTSLTWSAKQTKFLNCDMECGETILAMNASERFKTNGIEYGLLENLGTPDLPQIYTHNINIGSLSFVALEALGLPTQYKFLLPLSIYGLGLFYVYLTVRRVSNNKLCALITLGLFATCYWGLGAFALNALRSWHL